LLQLLLSFKYNAAWYGVTLSGVKRLPSSSNVARAPKKHALKLNYCYANKPKPF